MGINSKIKIQLLIFLALFLLAEIALRFFGLRPGTLVDDFKIEAQPEYQQRFYSDETGVNHIFPKAENLMKGSVINAQGFRSSFPFTTHAMDSLRKETKEKIIMVVGDSFVEGCCPDSVSESFPDILNRDSKYCVLNFGVAGTDPLQYELVIKKYIKNLQPDRVVVVLYFGNDVMNQNRMPSPGIPLTYPFKNNKWLYSVAPNHLSGKVNHVFKTPMEAYDFYLNHYTLLGQERNSVEKIFSYSVLFSKLYLFMEHKVAKWKWEKQHVKQHLDVASITPRILQKIEFDCREANVPCLFVGIPAPKEAKNLKKFRKKYSSILETFRCKVPENIKPDDYDGKLISNHFNNQGHLKYAKFLKELLDREPK